ncbi:helix-turn-helix transcriptional regulator [Gordonia alkanivorans]|uniref:helix-turn-helix domain-containing protein n=1 Tax=Gordonia alkanivorans TaxID=84096 RepID=UPI0024B750E6|nr:helix-turn-helix transcriptional regulator [Gordonia alkanivorans]MDJ0028445.1 helix-turn-helix transcriptional regulator [Gordonia alkanivorans]
MTSTATTPSVGNELRRWRELRSLSQLALATQAEVSTRHLSFVENGRSRPTPEMIVRLAEVMRVPMGEQNRLLLAGGYAPRYPHRATDDEALAPVMAGLRRLLDAHAPYPALLLDDHWDVVDANEPVDALVTGCDPGLIEPPLNVIRLCLHPRGLAPRIRNLPAWRTHLIHQLEQRIAHTGGDPDLVSLLEDVTAYPSDGTPPARSLVEPCHPDGDRGRRRCTPALQRDQPDRECIRRHPPWAPSRDFRTRGRHHAAAAESVTGN